MFKKTRILLVLGAAAAAMLVTACSSDGEEEPAAVISSDRPQATAEPAQAEPSPTETAPASPPASKERPLNFDSAPPLTIDPAKKYSATFKLAKGSEFEIELFADDAPNTVNNFVFLSRQGYYDGVTFHRVIPGFMAQGGDPTGTGRGGPGYSFNSEVTSSRRHDGPGVLSMANAGGIDTNGSQFFITFSDTHDLDGYELDGTAKPCEQRGVSCHTVFGKVVKGLDTAMAITPRDPNTARTPGDVITTIEITEE